MSDRRSFYFTLETNYKYIKSDLSVYWDKRPRESLLSALLYVLTCHGLHIMIMFRLSKIIYSIKIPVVSHVLKILFQLSWFLITTFYGIWIDLSSKIGPGFYIGHFGGIIIRGDFGENCSLGQCVTVGSKGAGKSNGWPTIGNNVYMGAGAKVIGSITVGNNVTIGANAVVTKNVPDNSLAVGVPARIKPLDD